ncbi:MAG TPA: hypothetical protein VLX44_18380 [Xanthobacteraceae bacterium]|nr:hypothetical protein [Xanthobacteraceae bacterium]
MSMQRDHRAGDRDPDAILQTLWVGAALVAMVAFSYWLNTY